MTNPSPNWNAMVKALAAFHQAHGHGNVPAAWPKDRQLGRWVAAQRYRRKVGELPPEQVAQLDHLGFVWSAPEATWESLFAQLAEFKRRYGHCAVPTPWPENPRLATWVSNQRHRKKTGALPPARALEQPRSPRRDGPCRCHLVSCIHTTPRLGWSGFGTMPLSSG